jgi:hypothetical protein
MTAVGVLNPNSQMKDYGRDVTLSLPPASLAARITRAEVDRLANEWQGRLQLAAFHNEPLVRIHELQKQVILLKTMKVGLR